MVIGLRGVQFGLKSRSGSSICLSRVSEYNFRGKKNSKVMKERENLHYNTDKVGIMSL